MIDWLRRQRRRGQNYLPTLTSVLDDTAKVALDADIVSELTFDHKTGVLHYHFKPVPRGIDAELVRLSEEGTN